MRLKRHIVACLVAPLACVLAACSLNGTINIAEDGQAQISVSAVVERSLTDSDQACEQVLQSVFADFLQVEDVEITSNSDAENLTCEASLSINLNDQRWDGHDGRPLWQAGPATYEPEVGITTAELNSGPKTMSIGEGQHRLFLPLSQGSQGIGVTEAIAAELSGQIQPKLTITMPEEVTSASSGTIDGKTVTLDGVSDFIKDLDIVTGGSWWDALTFPTRVALIGGGGVVILAAALLAVAHHRKKRRQRSK